MRIPLAALLLALAVPTTARSDGSVVLALTPDGQQLATELGVTPADLQQRLEAKLADLYETANVDGFLRAFANATSFASRGVGVDYAPLFDNLEIGITANVAAAVDGLDRGTDPAAGLAPNVSLFAGLSLSRWGHEALTLYANGFHRSADIEGLQGSITNVGVHGQYHLFAPAKDASTLLFLWTGLHLTGGIEVSRWSFHAGDTLQETFPLDGANGTTAAIDSVARGTFDLAATATTIPLEVTTSARILYFAGIYVGAGVDLQAGKASAEAALDGTLRGTLPSSGRAIDVGTATITASGESGPSPLAFHVLAGVELNLWRLKAFAQATVVPVDGASVGFGLRLRL